jgi:hypothetical protein
MKLFAKTLLTWREPFLISARMRSRKGWMLRGLLALVIFAAMMFAFTLDRGKPGRRPKFSPVGAVVLSAVIGVLLTSLLDAPDLNREATITEKEISSFGNAGTVHSMASWKLGDVQSVRLVRPAELGRSFGLMEVTTAKGGGVLGVPSSMAPERIADVLHRQGVTVFLSGWTPPAAEAAPAPRSFATPPAVFGPPTTSARIERLPEQAAGRILTPGRFNLALGLALAPLAVALIGGPAMFGTFAYRHWFLHAPTGPIDLACLLGGVIVFVGGLWFTMRFANLIPSLYLLGAIRSEIEMRPGALFNPMDPETIYIDVVPRANWGKVMLREFSDTGLLKVDEATRSVLFEGDQERWRIPVASLMSVGVESYRPGPSAEGQQGGEVLYYTVLKAQVGDTTWEAPVRKCHTEWRPKDNALREANAIALRDRIAALRGEPARAVQSS